MVGSNRVLLAQKIVNPVGNAELDPAEEKKLRRSIVEKALKVLQTDIENREFDVDAFTGTPKRNQKPDKKACI